MSRKDTAEPKGEKCPGKAQQSQEPSALQQQNLRLLDKSTLLRVSCHVDEIAAYKPVSPGCPCGTWTGDVCVSADEKHRAFWAWQQAFILPGTGQVGTAG